MSDGFVVCAYVYLQNVLERAFEMRSLSYRCALGDANAHENQNSKEIENLYSW